MLVGKTSCGLVLGEHELVRTVKVWHESGASGVHGGVEADLGLRRVLKRGVLRKLLGLGLGLGAQEGLISKEIRKLGSGIRQGHGKRAGSVPVDSAALQRDPVDGSGFGGGARCEDCRAAVAVVAAAAGAAAGSGEAELAVAGYESGSWAPLGTGYDPPSDRAGRRGRDGGGRETRTSCLFAGVVDMLFLPAFAPGHGRYLVVVRYVLVRPCLQYNVPVAVRLAPRIATHILHQHLRLGSTPEPVPQPHRDHHTHYYRRQSKNVAPAHQVEVVCARHLLQPASDGGVDDSHTEDAEGSADPKGDKAYTNVRAYNIDDPMRRQRCDSEHDQKRQHVLLVVLDLACPLVHERLPPRQGQQRGPKCRRNEIA